ncbi:hypothetical protein POTOM_042815 [Populus tomentosa]|uniref:Membrane-associated kinase regulator 6 n=1 Tax=Populus tomentosa TaxID=118781 RepID=A0A8X7YPH1_POPTO|nr:hypothetical protein POTOM_042815 [Populus tomentosa]
METSQPLSIESFSYSWLVNLKPSLESLDNSLRASLDASDEASFIEMDPRMPPSKRFFRNSQDFKFDFPISQSPLTLVHADELFSNGYVMPLFVDPLKMEAYDVSDSTSALHTSSHAPKTVVSACKPQRCSSLRRCRRLSKQIVQKYLDFLRPLYRRIRGHRSSSRAENIDSKVQYSIAKDPMGNKLRSLYKGVEKKRRKAAMLIFTWERKRDWNKERSATTCFLFFSSILLGG